jgi:hypothetical protein
MTREPDTTKPIAWYAYQDSTTTNREYYHEPISGETTWVMPSLLRCTTTTNDTRMGVGVKAAVNNDDTAVQHSRTGKDSVPSSSRLRQFGVVGGTVIFILLFNTLFLLVVIRLIANDDGIMTITHLFRGQELPLPKSSEMMDLTNESHHHCNDINIDAMDAAAAVTTENTLENPLILPAPGPGVQQSDNSVISNDATINHDGTHKQGGKDIETTANIHINNNDTIHPPINCWIPFSYIIIGKCRRHAREGLPMPLADASSIPLI